MSELSCGPVLLGRLEVLKKRRADRKRSHTLANPIFVSGLRFRVRFRWVSGLFPGRGSWRISGGAGMGRNRHPSELIVPIRESVEMSLLGAREVPVGGYFAAGGGDGILEDITPRRPGVWIGLII
jgi:hypothetical protein